ncbi:hypothetical protein, partial [Undibacterium sp.]|uniref:hypothetical protein n=1 Tax=Undibacterium sp. TaxID=1914977 RepID=UPI002D01EFCA
GRILREPILTRARAHVLPLASGKRGRGLQGGSIVSDNRSRPQRMAWSSHEKSSRTASFLCRSMYYAVVLIVVPVNCPLVFTVGGGGRGGWFSC